MRRRSLSFIALVAVTALAVGVTTSIAPTHAQSARTETANQVKKRLLGTWQLVSAVVVDQRGRFVSDLYGKHPQGKLTYTSTGDVWAYTGQGGTVKSERPANWYTGTFSINVRNHTVIHYAAYSSIRSWEGTRLIRRYEFPGSRQLTLSTVPTGIVLRWKKVAP